MTRIDTPARKAAVFFGYVVLSIVIGERFPFSRFTMFSAAHASESCFDTRVDGGREADYRDYTGFHGAFTDLRVENVDAWEEKEVRRLVAQDASAQSPAGAVKLEILVCRSSVDAAGAAIDCRAMWSGEASRR